ncbi:MAG: ABC transporter permease [Acidimicrobiales bacterium]
MSGAIIFALVLVFLALRLWFRFRRRASGGERRVPIGAGPFTGDVALVAAREVRERIRGRIFRVGTLLILVVVAAAIVIPTTDRGTPQPQRVGVVGDLSAPLRATVLAAGKSIGTGVNLVPEASLATARAGLRSGRLDLAIVDAREIVADKPVSVTDTSTTAALVLTLAKVLGVAEAVEAAHLSAAQSAQLSRARALPVASVQPGKAKGAAQTTSVIGLILVFVMLTQYNGWILIGVMEEKSSRVVEVLLAAVRPIQLLAGKVLGIGLVALAQASLIVVFALVLAKAVGSDLLKGTAPVVLVSTLVWLVLGYAFYCWVYAAAGSMAERQDQVQSMAFPLSLPIIAGYIISLITLTAGGPSTFFDVLAYLPPTAPFAMPVLVAFGAVTWWEFAASAALSIVCTVGVARLAALIYRRAILRTGRRVQLREVISRATR